MTKSARMVLEPIHGAPSGRATPSCADGELQNRRQPSGVRRAPGMGVGTAPIFTSSNASLWPRRMCCFTSSPLLSTGLSLRFRFGGGPFATSVQKRHPAVAVGPPQRSHHSPNDFGHLRWLFKPELIVPTSKTGHWILIADVRAAGFQHTGDPSCRFRITDERAIGKFVDTL
jgi:hypothetical protein